MTKRLIIRSVLERQTPLYISRSCGFTLETREKLPAHFAPIELEDALKNHLLKLGSDIALFRHLDNDRM